MINCSYVFTEIGYFKAHSHYMIKKVGNHTKHHLDTWHMHYKKPFKNELEILQEQQIIAGKEEPAEWCTHINKANA